MKNTRMLRNIAFGALTLGIGLSANAAVNLTTFAPGTPIKSSEVNANFSSLKANVEALQTPIGISRLAIGGTPGDGKVLKFQSGNLIWADDLVGGANGNYFADDATLALTGTTFSVKDAGIKVNQLADGAVSTPKLASAAVTNAKLADGSVSANKLSFPIVVSGPLNALGFSVTNTSTAGVAVGLRGQGGGGAGLTLLGAIGVLGESTTGFGVIGASRDLFGVYGTSSASVALFGENDNAAETLRLTQHGLGALIDAHGPNGNTVFSVDGKGNVFSATNSYSSDRRLKTNLRALNAQALLERIAALPVTRWNYTRDSASVQHIGPMAQDFHAAFGVNGSDETHINVVDMQGVTLAGLQGVYARNRALEARVNTLEARLAALERAIKRSK